MDQRQLNQPASAASTMSEYAKKAEETYDTNYTRDDRNSSNVKRSDLKHFVTGNGKVPLSNGDDGPQRRTRTSSSGSCSPEKQKQPNQHGRSRSALDGEVRVTPPPSPTPLSPVSSGRPPTRFGPKTGKQRYSNLTLSSAVSSAGSIFNQSQTSGTADTGETDEEDLLLEDAAFQAAFLPLIKAFHPLLKFVRNNTATGQSVGLPTILDNASVSSDGHAEELDISLLAQLWNCTATLQQLLFAENVRKYPLFNAATVRVPGGGFDVEVVVADTKIWDLFEGVNCPAKDQMKGSSLQFSGVVNFDKEFSCVPGAIKFYGTIMIITCHCTTDTRISELLHSIYMQIFYAVCPDEKLPVLNTVMHNSKWLTLKAPGLREYLCYSTSRRVAASHYVQDSLSVDSQVPVGLSLEVSDPRDIDSNTMYPVLGGTHDIAAEFKVLAGCVAKHAKYVIQRTGFDHILRRHENRKSYTRRQGRQAHNYADKPFRVRVHSVRNIVVALLHARVPSANSASMKHLSRDISTPSKSTSREQSNSSSSPGQRPLSFSHSDKNSRPESFAEYSSPIINPILSNGPDTPQSGFNSPDVDESIKRESSHATRLGSSVGPSQSFQGIVPSNVLKGNVRVPGSNNFATLVDVYVSVELVHGGDTLPGCRVQTSARQFGDQVVWYAARESSCFQSRGDDTDWFEMKRAVCDIPSDTILRVAVLSRESPDSDNILSEPVLLGKVEVPLADIYGKYLDGTQEIRLWPGQYSISSSPFGEFPAASEESLKTEDEVFCETFSDSDSDVEFESVSGNTANREPRAYQREFSELSEQQEDISKITGQFHPSVWESNADSLDVNVFPSADEPPPKISNLYRRHPLCVCIEIGEFLGGIQGDQPPAIIDSDCRYSAGKMLLSAIPKLEAIAVEPLETKLDDDLPETMEANFTPFDPYWLLSKFQYTELLLKKPNLMPSDTSVAAHALPEILLSLTGYIQKCPSYRALVTTSPNLLLFAFPFTPSTFAAKILQDTGGTGFFDHFPFGSAEKLNRKNMSALYKRDKEHESLIPAYGSWMKHLWRLTVGKDTSNARMSVELVNSSRQIDDVLQPSSSSFEDSLSSCVRPLIASSSLDSINAVASSYSAGTVGNGKDWYVQLEKCGWMRKLGPHKWCRWKRRWFELSETTGALIYFASSASPAAYPKGFLCLAGMYVRPRADLNRTYQRIVGSTRKDLTLHCLEICPAKKGQQDAKHIKYLRRKSSSKQLKSLNYQAHVDNEINDIKNEDHAVPIFSAIKQARELGANVYNCFSSRSFFLYTDSQPALDEWVDCINTVIRSVNQRLKDSEKAREKVNEKEQTDKQKPKRDSGTENSHHSDAAKGGHNWLRNKLHHKRPSEKVLKRASTAFLLAAQPVVDSPITKQRSMSIMGNALGEHFSRQQPKELRRETTIGAPKKSNRKMSVNMGFGDLTASTDVQLSRFDAGLSYWVQTAMLNGEQKCFCDAYHVFRTLSLWPSVHSVFSFLKTMEIDAHARSQISRMLVNAIGASSDDLRLHKKESKNIREQEEGETQGVFRNFFRFLSPRGRKQDLDDALPPTIRRTGGIECLQRGDVDSLFDSHIASGKTKSGEGRRSHCSTFAWGREIDVSHDTATTSLKADFRPAGQNSAHHPGLSGQLLNWWSVLNAAWESSADESDDMLWNTATKNGQFWSTSAKLQTAPDLRYSTTSYKSSRTDSVDDGGKQSDSWINIFTNSLHAHLFSRKLSLKCDEEVKFENNVDGQRREEFNSYSNSIRKNSRRDSSQMVTASNRHLLNNSGVKSKGVLLRSHSSLRQDLPQRSSPTHGAERKPVNSIGNDSTSTLTVEGTVLPNNFRQIFKTDSLYKPNVMDRTTLWQHRQQVTGVPESLPKLLRCISFCSRTQVRELHRMLYTWELFPQSMLERYLELLDDFSGDQQIRHFAICCLERLSDSAFAEIIPQLVQSLKHEPHLLNSVFQVLLRRAVAAPILIGVRLFWYLNVEACGCLSFYQRYAMYIQALVKQLPSSVNSEISAQQQLWSRNGFFAQVCEFMQEHKKLGRDKRKELLQRVLKNNMHMVPTRHTLPIDGRVEVGRLRVDGCNVLDSAKRPLWLTFENPDNALAKICQEREEGNVEESESISRAWNHDDIKVIFKAGDDIRQDTVTLQLLSAMDRWWRESGLDLRLTIYRCMSTWNNGGLVEIVRDADTLAQIQVAHGGKLGAYRENVLYDWLASHNGPTDSEQFMSAVDNFTRSVAGYCAATYVLGIGDRHNDNIMIKRSGHYFHIDFGHILGNFKYQFGIARERSAFVFTNEMANVMGGKGSGKYQEFVYLATQAYLILREHASELVNMFSLMIPSDMPELKNREDIGFIRERLAIDLGEQQAKEKFEREIEKALSNRYKLFDDTIHILKHA